MSGSSAMDHLNNGTISGGYGKTDQEQINRATVGQGTIIIRSDPSKGLEGLNRDLAKAQEMTKNEKVNVTVYIDSKAISEVANGFPGIIEGVGQLGENLKTIVREWQAAKAVLPDNAKHLADVGLDAMKAMIRNGASEEDVAKLMTDPKYLELLGQGKHGWLAVSRIGQYGVEYTDSNHAKQVDYVINGLGEVYAYLDGLEYKGTIEAAIIGLQVATSGPAVVVKGLLAGAVTGAVTQALAESIVLGNQYGGRSLSETYAYLRENYSGDEFVNQVDKLNNNVSGVQLVLDSLWGIGTGALAGGIKVAKIEPIRTIPGKIEGQMLGANGAKTSGSQTIRETQKWHVDIENTNPGDRPANIHIQLKGDENKYYFNPSSNYFYTKDNLGVFTPISASQNKGLLSDSSIMNAISKGLYYLKE